MNGLSNLGRLICLTAHFNMMKESAAQTASTLGHSLVGWKDFKSLYEGGISNTLCSKCKKTGMVRMTGPTIDECYLGEVFIRKCGESIESYIQRHSQLVKQ